MQYIDNYPNNIESPVRLYTQYSSDIEFDYTNGQYPIGSEAEGFFWENQFTPVEHQVNGNTIPPHVWMRYRLGTDGAWTAPIRIGGNVVQNMTMEPISESPGDYTFVITLGDGSTQIIELTGIKGEDGIDGIDGVDGIDGQGWNLFTVPGPILQWSSPVLVHNPAYMHITTNGISGQALQSSGDGTFTWDDNLWFSNLDDTAGTGDLDKLYSADKILALIGTSSYGIKYVVTLLTDLASITGMDPEDLAVVDGDPTEPNRPVYRWDGATWNFFFEMDSTHNHDSRYYTELELDAGQLDNRYYTETEVNILFLNYYTRTQLDNGVLDSRYYTETELSTPSSGAAVDWTNIQNAPTMLHDDTSTVGDVSANPFTVLNAVAFDTYGHVQSVGTLDLQTIGKTLRITDGSLLLEEDHGGPSVPADYNPFDSNYNFRLKVNYDGSGSAATAARSDHTHDFSDQYYVHGFISTTTDLDNLRVGTGALPGDKSSTFRLEGSSLPLNMPSQTILNSGSDSPTLVNNETPFDLKVTVLGNGFMNWYVRQEIFHKRSRIAYRYHGAFGWSSWNSHWSSGTDVFEGSRECSVISPAMLRIGLDGSLLYKGRLTITDDLDTVLVAGIYEFDSYGTHSLPSNIPVGLGNASFYMKVFVVKDVDSVDNPRYEQKVYLVGGSTFFWKRHKLGTGAWSAWSSSQDDLPSNGSWASIPVFYADFGPYSGGGLTPLESRAMADGSIQLTGWIVCHASGSGNYTFGQIDSAHTPGEDHLGVAVHSAGTANFTVRVRTDDQITFHGAWTIGSYYFINMIMPK